MQPLGMRGWRVMGLMAWVCLATGAKDKIPSPKVKAMSSAVSSFPGAPVFDPHKPLQEHTQDNDRFVLPTGLRVVLLENHEQPLVRLELRSVFVSSTLAGREWCVPALAEALNGGAGGMNKGTFLSNLEASGLRLQRCLGERFFSCGMLADSSNQEAAFEHLAHAVFRPQWDGEGDEAARLDANARVALHRALVRPEQSILVIRGDMDLRRARTLALLAFGTWAPAVSPLPTLPSRQSSRLVSPLPVLSAQERAAHLLLAWMLEKEVTDAKVGVEVKREDGQPGSIRIEPIAKPWVKALCERGFTSAALLAAKRAILFERVALPLHPEALVAHTAMAEMWGDPGAYVLTVKLEAVNKALVQRLGSL